jgi:hypothetical protein
MNQSPRYYIGQFAAAIDLLHVTIPRDEIVAQMLERGEQDTLNDVCLAVAVVADAIANAQSILVRTPLTGRAGGGAIGREDGGARFG